MFKNSSDELWSNPELRIFLGAINRRCSIVETLALPTMRDLPPARIETLFVPPYLSNDAVSADSEPAEWPSGKSLLEELETSPRLVVLGDPGGGKTTLSNWIAWRLTSGSTAPLPKNLQNILPVPCVLREMPKDLFTDSTGVIDVVKYVTTRALGESKALTIYDTLAKWIYSGRFILILDGIDEIPIEIRSHVARWINECQERKSCLLATSRIVGYQDYPVDGPRKEDNQRNKLSDRIIRRLAYTPHVDDRKDSESSEKRWAEVRYLMPFNQSQIADFARNWYRQRCTSDKEAKGRTLDLLAALKESEVTAKLARTPNLLSLMAIVHRERAHLPDGKALLYEEIANAYINTIDSQRKILQGDVLSRYTWKEKKGWLAYIGFMMQSANKPLSFAAGGIVVPEAKVLGWLEKAMRTSGVEDARDVATEFLDWVARRSGLLLPRGEGFYAFVHLSFQEYFCSCYLESCVVSPSFFEKNTKKGIVKVADFKTWAESSSWVETLVFLFETLSNERTSSWVTSLAYSIYDQYPKRVSISDGIANLASRLLSNKHVKLPRNWTDYLAAIASVDAYRLWDTQASANPLAAFLHSGYALAIEDSDTASYRSFPPAPQTRGAINKADVRILLYRSKNILNADELKQYPNLTVLHCENCSVFDLENSGPWPELQLISVMDSMLKGAELLGSMKRLTALELIRVKQEGINAGPACKSVTEAMFCDVNLESVDFLKGWTKLESLDVTSTDVEDASAIGTLKNLQYLTIDSCRTKNADFISKLTNLEYLGLTNCPITQISRLNLRNLMTVNFDNLKITSLRCISELPNVQGVVIRNCPIVSLIEAGLSSLTYLLLHHLPLKSLDGIEAFSSMRSLSLKDIAVTDFSPLERLSKLGSLRIDSMSIENISWIGKLKSLMHLALLDTPITDISPLLKARKLQRLEISESTDLDLSILKNSKIEYYQIKGKKVDMLY
jgi:Leucine-rich repeat (LRR) protein